MSDKKIWIGIAIGIGLVWVGKNAPVVGPITSPLLAKVGL